MTDIKIIIEDLKNKNNILNNYINNYNKLLKEEGLHDIETVKNYINGKYLLESMLEAINCPYNYDGFYHYIKYIFKNKEYLDKFIILNRRNKNVVSGNYNDLNHQEEYYEGIHKLFELKSEKTDAHIEIGNTNIIKYRPIKVTLNKTYHNKYLNILINNKKDEKKIITNKNFVLYRFKNVVNKIIYKNKKRLFHERINKSIIHMKTYISNMLPPKVSLNDAFHNKYKKERIISNINKLKLIYNKIILNNRIKKFLIKYKKEKNKAINILNKNKKIITNIINSNGKYKKSNVYNVLYKNNRDMIDLYSNYYEEYILNNKKDEIKLLQEYHDKNSGRFLRMLELFNKIRKDVKLYNCSYLFNYYKLSDVTKKDENYNFFLQDLRFNIGFDDRNHKVTLGDAYYDYYNNIYLHEDEEIVDSYDEFIYTCIFCRGTKDIDLNNGTCITCKNNMNKKDDYYYNSDYEY